MAWGVRGRVFVVALALVVFAAGCMPEEPPAPEALPPPPKVLVVYGDSLVVESYSYINGELASLLPGWEVVFHVYGGTAQCDFHPSMIDDANALNIGAVVIAFSGNNLTPCIQSRPYVEGYTADAIWAATFWRERGVPLVFVAAPGFVGTEVAQALIAKAYLSVASAQGVHAIDSAPLFAEGTPARFGTTMPCLEDECTSTITVRSPDGAHFCPVNVLGLTCPPTYSSGAVRFSEIIRVGVARLLAIAHSPIRSLAATPPPTTPSTSTPTTSSPSTSTPTTSPSTTSTPTTSTTAPPSSTTTPTTVLPSG